MTINLDTEIESTSFDPSSGLCKYVLCKNGKHWTVELHLDTFEKAAKGVVGPQHRLMRRRHLASHLELAMRGPSDEDKDRKEKGVENASSHDI